MSLIWDTIEHIYSDDHDVSSPHLHISDVFTYGAVRARCFPLTVRKFLH